MADVLRSGNVDYIVSSTLEDAVSNQGNMDSRDNTLDNVVPSDVNSTPPEPVVPRPLRICELPRP